LTQLVTQHGHEKHPADCAANAEGQEAQGIWATPATNAAKVRMMGTNPA